MSVSLTNADDVMLIFNVRVCAQRADPVCLVCAMNTGPETGSTHSETEESINKICWAMVRKMVIFVFLKDMSVKAICTKIA